MPLHMPAKSVLVHALHDDHLSERFGIVLNMCNHLRPNNRGRLPARERRVGPRAQLDGRRTTTRSPLTVAAPPLTAPDAHIPNGSLRKFPFRSDRTSSHEAHTHQRSDSQGLTKQAPASYRIANGKA